MAEDYDNNKPEEMGSEASDFIKDEDLNAKFEVPDEDDENYQQDDWTKIEGKCAECGDENIWQIGYMRSPDDYSFNYKCRSCGEEWSD